jgi:hypothetical protein
MSEEIQAKSLADLSVQTPWDTLIADAQSRIVQLELLVSRLKSSVKRFEKMRDGGIAFPRRPRGRPPGSKAKTS